MGYVFAGLFYQDRSYKGSDNFGADFMSRVVSD